MIALLEHGEYSDYTVDIIAVDEPWEAWAYCVVKDECEWFGDGRTVMAVIDGQRIWPKGGKGDHWRDDFLDPDALNSPRDRCVAKVGLPEMWSMIAKTGKFCDGREWINRYYRPTPEQVDAAMRKAKGIIEAEAAAKGKRPPWEVAP